MLRFLKAGKDDGGEDIPDVLLEGDEADYEEAWEAFKLLEAFSDGDGAWRFLPSQVLAEPEPLLSNVMRIRFLKGRLKDATK